MITLTPASCRASIAFGRRFLDRVGDGEQAGSASVDGDEDDASALVVCRRCGLAIQILRDADTRFLQELRACRRRHGLAVDFARDAAAGCRFEVRHVGDVIAASLRACHDRGGERMLAGRSRRRRCAEVSFSPSRRSRDTRHARLALR